MNSKKIIIFINFILIVSLIIIISEYNKQKIVINNKHHYKCYQYLKNDELGIKYNYYFNIDTNEFDILINNEYVEEFIYNNKDYYKSAKSFYEENSSQYNVVYNDKKQSIIRSNKIELGKDHKKYDEYIKTSIPSGFKCEEIL